ncbi:hypothetical protein BH11PLA2_BH11PLA2_52120 [soil metagenome]
MSRRKISHTTTRFESKHQPVIGYWPFVKRMAISTTVSSMLIFWSLVGGMYGYHVTEDMQWIDAFANASMILSGMGPLASPVTWNGKFFAGCYALYSGLVLVVASGLILAPIMHRVLHHFHVDCEDK